jgi:hypothetical protein
MLVYIFVLLFYISVAADDWSGFESRFCLFFQSGTAAVSFEKGGDVNDGQIVRCKLLYLTYVTYSKYR